MVCQGKIIILTYRLVSTLHQLREIRILEIFKEKQPKDILDISMDDLSLWFKTQGMQPYRARQVLKWIYTGQANGFSEMTNLGKDLRCLLDKDFYIGRLKLLRAATSADGSKKYLFKLLDGNHIETVLIPERNHYTLCISSQVGCAQGCKFCLTAHGGFIRNLTRSEIIAQVRDVGRLLPDPSSLTNIVIMGMGEPLANYENVVGAIQTLTDNDFGLKYAGRRITLSTVGWVPKLAALGRDTTVNLAVSLNAADDDTRNFLMPINRKHPIEELLEACRNYPLRPHRRITFEYILIKGVNDSADHAKRLAKRLRSLKTKINLIPFNEHGGCDFKRPDEAVILKFQEILINSHYTVIIRRSKGEDIYAACGQLRANFPAAVISSNAGPQPGESV
jgi:23S rRNA (adenine2503-C2)-methyltransferase